MVDCHLPILFQLTLTSWTASTAVLCCCFFYGIIVMTLITLRKTAKKQPGENGNSQLKRMYAYVCLSTQALGQSQASELEKSIFSPIL